MALLIFLEKVKGCDVHTTNHGWLLFCKRHLDICQCALRGRELLNYLKNELSLSLNRLVLQRKSVRTGHRTRLYFIDPQLRLVFVLYPTETHLKIINVKNAH